MHPEQAKNEIFIGNVPSRDTLARLKELSALTTVRQGKIAYDIHGKQLSPDYMRPMFVNQKEAAHYDKIMIDDLKKIRTGKRKIKS